MTDGLPAEPRPAGERDARPADGDVGAGVAAVETPIRRVVRERFGGVLTVGKHSPDGEACALEARSVAMGIKWTDSPTTTRFPDIRALNDAAWPSDEARTAGMLDLMDALWDWPDWTNGRRKRFGETIALRLEREIIAPMLRERGMTATEADACAEVTTLNEAEQAAAWAAGASRHAENAAEIANLAVRIWIEAAQESEAA